jgi:hypothetical protein
VSAAQPVIVVAQVRKVTSGLVVVQFSVEYGLQATQVLQGNESLHDILIQSSVLNTQACELFGSQVGNAAFGTGFQLQPGQTLSFEDYTGPLYALISGAGPVDLRVLTTVAASSPQPVQGASLNNAAAR